MNVELQLETRVVLIKIVWGGDGKRRTMANEAFCRRQKVIGMVYRSQIGKVLTQLPHEETTR